MKLRFIMKYFTPTIIKDDGDAKKQTNKQDEIQRFVGFHHVTKWRMERTKDGAKYSTKERK